MEAIVEQVSPVVRPLLATFILSAAVPTVPEGGAAGRLVVPAVAPRSRMVPAVSTVPLMIMAMAASTLLGEGPVRPCVVPAGASGACCVRLATGMSLAKQAGCPG